MRNKTVRLFHSTSKESFDSILENGFNPSLVESTWNCSESDYTYFYNPLAMIEHGESEDLESSYEMCINRAFENGKISAAIQKSKGDSLYVLELEVPIIHVELDDSCDNMELACKVSNNNLNQAMIKAVYSSDFLVSMTLVYLANLTNNDFINLGNFSAIEIQAMEIIGESSLSELLQDNYGDYEDVTGEFLS